MSNIVTNHQVYLGYTTSVYLFKQSTPIFCTSLSFSINQQIITSQGSFYGDRDIDTHDRKFRAYGPLRLDYPDITANISFQITSNILDKLIDSIKDRTKKIDLKIRVGSKLDQDAIKFEQCYWNNISLSTAQGQLLTCSMSLLIRDEYAQRKIQKFNDPDIAKFGTGSNLVDLGKMYCESTIIPYYATGARIEGADNRDKYITGWSMQLTQNLNKKVYCVGQNYAHNDSQAPLPEHILFGNINASLKITVLNAGTAIPLYKPVADSINFSEKTIKQNDNITIYCDRKKFLTFGYNMLQSVAPVVSQQSSLQQIQYSYISHKITH